LEDPELAGAACDLMHNDYADQQRTQGKGTPSYETPLGRGYRVRLSKFAYIQPDIQW
jgi:porin